LRMNKRDSKQWASYDWHRAQDIRLGNPDTASENCGAVEELRERVAALNARWLVRRLVYSD